VVKMFNNDLLMTNGVSNTIGGDLLINIMQAVTVFQNQES